MQFSIDAFVADWMLYFQSQLDGVSGAWEWLVDHPEIQVVVVALSTVVGYDVAKRSCRWVAGTFQFKRNATFFLTSRLAKKMGWMLLFPPYWTGIIACVACDLALIPLEILCCFGLRTNSPELRKSIGSRVSSVASRVKKMAGLASSAPPSDVEDEECDSDSEEECDDSLPSVASADKMVEHHPNGAIALQADVVYLTDGSWLFHGSFTRFHPNGRVAETGTYAMGEPQKVVRYNANGKKL